MIDLSVTDLQAYTVHYVTFVSIKKDRANTKCPLTCILL